MISYALGAREAARYLGIGLRTMERLIERGEIPICRINAEGRTSRTGKRLFRVQDLEAFVDRHMNEEITNANVRIN